MKYTIIEEEDNIEEEDDVDQEQVATYVLDEKAEEFYHPNVLENVMIDDIIQMTLMMMVI